jgi:UDP:flavonoid glycosyltransferase YjiC (YdhE family)
MEQDFANADLVMTHPISAAFTSIACELIGVPWVVGDLFPMFLPSGSNPMPGMPNLGPVLNRRGWSMGRSALFDPISGATPFKKERRRRGLPARGWSLVDARSSPYLNLGLFSRHYMPAQPDWPQPYEVVGFTSWREPPGYVLPDEASGWLADGPPPVLVTLGTSGASAHPELFRAAAAALDDEGARGLFLVSTEANRASLAGINETHGVWPFLPLGAILPHCRAVIHSGAHGTNALVLQAGLPSAVRPCLIDQIWHARRHQELGTGIWIKRDDFQGAVRRLLRDDTLRANAVKVAGLMATENGSSAASDAIEAYLAA